MTGARELAAAPRATRSIGRCDRCSTRSPGATTLVNRVMTFGMDVGWRRGAVSARCGCRTFGLVLSGNRAATPPRIHPERHHPVHQVVAARRSCRTGDRTARRFCVALRGAAVTRAPLTRHAPCRRAPRAPPRRPPRARCAPRRSPAAHAGNRAKEPAASRPAAAPRTPPPHLIGRLALRPPPCRGSACGRAQSNSSTARSARPCNAASASRASRQQVPESGMSELQQPERRPRQLRCPRADCSARRRPRPAPAGCPLALHRLDQRRHRHPAPIGELLERQQLAIPVRHPRRGRDRRNSQVGVGRPQLAADDPAGSPPASAPSRCRRADPRGSDPRAPAPYHATRPSQDAGAGTTRASGSTGRWRRKRRAPRRAAPPGTSRPTTLRVFATVTVHAHDLRATTGRRRAWNAPPAMSASCSILACLGATLIRGVALEERPAPPAQ